MLLILLLGNEAAPKLCLTSKDESSSLTLEIPLSLTRCAADSVAHQGASLLLTEPHGAKTGNPIENAHYDSASSVEMPTDECLVESRALVAVPTMGSREALPVVPVQQRLGKSEISQRRVRRPFSVAEVEALVHTVEKLGTGRCVNPNNIMILFEAVQALLLIYQHLFFLGSRC